MHEDKYISMYKSFNIYAFFAVILTKFIVGIELSYF